MKGVIYTRVGYTGNNLRKWPTYNDLKGHTEVIQIKYDIKQFNIDKFLKKFIQKYVFKYPSLYKQYRIGIWYNNIKQKSIVLKYINEYESKTKKKTTMFIDKLGEFYLAEDYHQKYKQKQKAKKKNSNIILHNQIDGIKY
mmetsp:Transcript_74063/g.90912  ORF Transcript_74063/g.90912 Transcript_74063/m.90912 type:complete len:140 (+) Transcript_74063:146-565(+)